MLRESAITDNTTTGNNSFGGGLAVEGYAQLVDSVVARNRSSAAGGGIALVQAAGSDAAELDVYNTTIADNTAGGNGGGLYTNARSTLASVTIAGNFAEGIGGGVYRAGLHDDWARNTLFARNARRGPAGYIPSACDGDRIAESDYSFADDATCQLQGAHDLPPAPARVERLQHNGGPTETVALQPSSPAVNHGDPGSCPDTDQRGVSRKLDQDCDIGAYETSSQPSEPVGHIAGRELDVAADGMGALQIRAGEDAIGAFAPGQLFLNEVGNGGLAFMIGDTYYPVASASATRERTAASGPRLISTGAGRRALRSEYYIGDKLFVTETVSYAEGAAKATVAYDVRNVSGAPVSFRAAQLATLSRAANGQLVGNELVVTAANNGRLRLANEGDEWRFQMGKRDSAYRCVRRLPGRSAEQHGRAESRQRGDRGRVGVHRRAGRRDAPHPARAGRCRRRHRRTPSTPPPTTPSARARARPATARCARRSRPTRRTPSSPCPRGPTN